MVIDDDLDSNQCIVNLLQKEGLETVGVLQAKKGIEYIQTGLFNLIVTEILMPEMDGIEVLIWMKKDKIHIPVIAISGGGKIRPEYYLTLAQHFGAHHTFVKPVNTLLFLYAIRKCLNQTNERTQ
ncbi:MAG TPA: response regulator [Chitinispirillaceae bacterium]|nr:response regulator [Chitinispirillaceae bacterium]